MKTQEIISTAFARFKREAEYFFVVPFLHNSEMEAEYTFCLDAIYNLTGEVDATKGVFAYNSNYGQGKTFFFDVVEFRHRRVTGKNLYKRTTAKELFDVYKEGGEEALLEAITFRNLFIDDIGDEGTKDDKVAFHFSNKLNVVRYVLLKRYEWWVDKGYKTFGTTNLSLKQFGGIYDGRVADRLELMCHFRTFSFLDEGSFRQNPNLKRITSAERAFRLAQVKPKEAVAEKPDVVGYMNYLLEQSEEYLVNRTMGDWAWIKDFLLEHGHLNAQDLRNISEEEIEAARLLVRQATKETVRIFMKNATTLNVSSERDRRLEAITREDAVEMAEAVVTRRRFFELKAREGFKFQPLCEQSSE